MTMATATCMLCVVLHKLKLIIARKMQMLYFHNISEEVEELATYTAKSYRLLWALRLKPHDQGLCPCTEWLKYKLGAQEL